MSKTRHPGYVEAQCHEHYTKFKSLGKVVDASVSSGSPAYVPF